MADAPFTVREVCRCGHDRATHFERSGACLGLSCDDCHVYADERKPAHVRVAPAPPSTFPKIPADDPPSAPAWPWGLYP